MQFGEVFATLYHNLGIEPVETTSINDPTGRPQHGRSSTGDRRS